MSDSHPPPPEPAAATWTVWRVDDNGNVFKVREHLSQAEAQALAADFEARGHKQMYWIEPETA